MAEDADSEAVEGADPDALAGQESVDAALHFARGFVGEGDRQDLAGPNAGVDQVGDARGDDARLAAARAGDD